MTKGWLCEIFDSIQGEGIYLGVRQIFLRFAGCNLRCEYCDTPQALRRHKYCRAMSHESCVMSKIENPMTVDSIIFILKSYLSNIQYPGSNIYHSVSLTGGEPLLQVDFIKELIPQLKKLGLKIYLETNGVLPDALKKIVDEVDFIAMDIKLPTAIGQKLWKEHKKFLKQCAMNYTTTILDRKMKCALVFVKIVITPRTSGGEIKKAAELIAEVNREIPLVLQPDSKKRDSPRPAVAGAPTTSSVNSDGPQGQSLFYYQEIASRILKDVRIIPQLHNVSQTICHLSRPDT